MPLVRFQIRNEYGLGDPELYRGAVVGNEGPKAILDGVAVTGLVGILRQLGDVAEFAAEIFHDLHEQVMYTSARGHKLLARIKQIEDTLPSIEDAARAKGSYIDLAYESGSSWHTDLRSMESYICSNGLPQFMIDSYEECRDPPRLYLLDKYDSAGSGACLKKYSDPSYFRRALSTSDHQKAQFLKRATNAGKSKKNSSWLRNGEVQHVVSTSRGNSSLASSTRFTSLSPGEQSFSAGNSTLCKMRLTPEVMSESPPMNSMLKLICTEKVSENPSSMLDDLEYDKSSGSNLDGNHDGPVASPQRDEELVIDANGDSQSEKTKVAGLKLSDDTIYGREQDLVNSERASTVIAEMAGSLSYQNQFDEVISDSDNYVDALNTVEFEVDTDSDCQVNPETQATVSQVYSFSSLLPSDTNSYSPITLQFKQPTSVDSCNGGSGASEDDVLLTMSRTNFQKTRDLESPQSNNCESESVLYCHSNAATSQSRFSPSTSIPYSASSRLWTNGYLLGLEPSNPREISLPSRTGEIAKSNSLDNDKPINGVAPPTFYEQGLIDKNEYGVLKKSNSSNSHYSDHSSPPLEHMKIAFHPMNDLEKSSMKLEFSERSVLPSFRLCPRLALSEQDGVSDSEEDTFCRSYPYSPEGLLNSRSDSNSELWEREDRPAGRKDELFVDFQRMFSTNASVSTSRDLELNFVEHEIGSKDFISEPFRSGQVGVIHDIRNGFLSISPEDCVMLPPPPPLPPLQWRLPKPICAVSGDEDANIDEANCSKKAKNINPSSSPFGEIGLNKKSDIQQKQKESSEAASNKGVDERDDLLHQIRSKTFNLRSTSSSIPSFTPNPIPNVKIAALLQKAHAIRQACASSTDHDDDDDDDDDDWGDG